ncbi:MAG: TonB-dependent receptor [Armatimonadetes bacterium]|nr:TonB-dependent receptor [Armatimonadota bacterium]
MYATLSRCRLRWLLIPLIAAVLAPMPCLASEDEDPSETEVVVTATRRRQAKQTASAAVTVITRAEIAASGAPTVAEVLRGAAGIDIPRQGPLGAAALPSLRGSSAGQVLVLVDGRRLNSPQHGDVDLSDIAIENVERIEVVRGGASALYGSDAVGGVINIITRAPSGEPEVRLSQGYGSFNTQLLSGLYSGSTGRLRYALTAQRTSATNDFEYFDAQAGREQTRNNAGYHSWDASVKLVADLGASRQLTFSAERSDAEKDLPGATSYPTPAAEQRDQRTLLDLHYLTPLGEGGDITGRLYRVEQENRYLDPDSFPAPTDATHRTVMDVGEVLGHSRLSGNQVLTYGIEARNQRLKSSMVGQHSRTTAAVFVQDQLELGRFQAIPGIRADFAKGFEGEISPKLGLVYQASEQVTLRANVGRSFRAPTLNDLYWPSDSFSTGNPNLRSEHAVTADIGATWRPAPSLELDATAFTHRVSDLISWQPGVVAPDKWSPVNVGKARIRGIEALATWKASERLQLSANMTYLDARDRSGAPDTDGKRLIIKPEFLANAGATYRLGKWVAGVDVRYTGRRPADQKNEHYLGAALVTDLRLEAPLGGAVTAAVHVSNLFDERYEAQPGYPLPGRAITLRLSERW